MRFKEKTRVRERSECEVHREDRSERERDRSERGKSEYRSQREVRSEKETGIREGTVSMRVKDETRVRERESGVREGGISMSQREVRGVREGGMQLAVSANRRREGESERRKHRERKGSAGRWQTSLIEFQKWVISQPTADQIHCDRTPR